MSWIVHAGLLALISAEYVAAPRPAAEAPQVIAVALAIENVTVIDTTARAVDQARRPRQTVLIEQGRITRVGPAGKLALPENAQRIDGAGKFLIPGLWDMHAHLNRDRWTQVRVMLPLLIANGVTGLRDCLGDCWEPCPTGRQTLSRMRRLQQRIEEGKTLGPRIVALSSPIVSGPLNNPSRGDKSAWPDFYQPTNAEQARKVVFYLKTREVDFIKIYNSLPREAFFALMKEAKRVGLDVSGHLPWSVSPSEASNAGVRTIEHARWPAMACTPIYDEFRAAFAKYAALEVDEFPAAIFKRYRDSIIPEFDAERCRQIMRTLVKNDTYLTPTHVTREMDARASDPQYRADPRRRFIPAPRLRGWDRDLKATADGPPELIKYYREFFELCLRVTGMAHKAGVKIMVGTDTLDTHCFPGFSLHDELEHLVRAGLTPLDALRAATIVPAEFMSRTDQFGSVAANRHADLILLTADPLDDIANTRKIDRVFFNGVMLDRAKLDSMIEGVEKNVRDRGG